MTPARYDPLKLPVSAKGALIVDDHALLLKNERDEWELPGGKLESGETLEQTVRREIEEETQLKVNVHECLHAWVYVINDNATVLVVVFACQSYDSLASLQVSSEHKEARWWPLPEVEALRMPNGYKIALSRLRSQ